MKILRKKDYDGDCCVFGSQLLIKSNGETEKKLPQMPLSDICMLLDYEVETVKKDYAPIQSSYDYGIIKLMLNASMASELYYQQCEIASFNSALYYSIYYDTDKLKIKDSNYVPVSLAALLSFLPEKRMQNLVGLEMKVYTDENGEPSISVTDFLEYYEKGLFQKTGQECDVRMQRKDDCVGILIKRELTDKTKNDE